MSAHETPRRRVRKTYDLWQIYHIPDIFAYGFCDDESSCQRLPCLLLDHTRQHPRQIFHVIMLVPPYRTPTNLNAFPDAVIHRLVSHDNIPPLAESRNNAGDGGECLRVDDAAGRAEKGSNVGLDLHVNILSAVEAGGAARAYAIGAEGLDRMLFQSLVGHEIVEIVGGEVGDGTAIGEFTARSSRA